MGGAQDEQGGGNVTDFERGDVEHEPAEVAAQHGAQPQPVGWRGRRSAVRVWRIA